MSRPPINAAIVTARAGSKSIIDKNVLPLRGKPMVQYPILAAQAASRIGGVWVSTDGDLLYVWTQGDSGKVKRIRTSGDVRVGPSDSRGGLQGADVPATARVLDSPADLARVAALHRAKYGLQFRLFDLGAKLLRRNRPLVALEITLH